jgi:uncharacterized protein
VSAFPCTVYRAQRRLDTYLYVHADTGLARVPADLRAQLGALDMALEIELTPDRRLARIDARDVMRVIEQDGYFLQLPRTVDGETKVSVVHYGE